MPNLNIEPVSLTKPTQDHRFLSVTFRLPSNPHDPIHPATRLQISLKHAASDFEAFLDALTSRDIVIDEKDSTFRSFSVPQSELPFLNRASAGSDMVPAQQINIMLHAWQGERWLGSWFLGTIEHDSLHA